MAAHPLSLLSPEEVIAAREVLDAAGELPEGSSVVHILLAEHILDILRIINGCGVMRLHESPVRYS